MHPRIAIGALVLIWIGSAALGIGLLRLSARTDGAALYWFALGFSLLYASASLEKAGRY